MEYEDKRTGKKYEISYSQKLQEKQIALQAKNNLLQENNNNLQKMRLIQRWIIIGLMVLIVGLFGVVVWTGVFSQVGRSLFCGG